MHSTVRGVKAQPLMAADGGQAPSEGIAEAACGEETESNYYRNYFKIKDNKWKMSRWNNMSPMEMWTTPCLGCYMPADTYAPSYASIAVTEAGAVANQVERKRYAHLGPGHIFTPVAIECSGVFGTETLKFVKYLKLASGENSACSSCTMGCTCYGFFGLRADRGLFLSICD